MTGRLSGRCLAILLCISNLIIAIGTTQTDYEWPTQDDDDYSSWWPQHRAGYGRGKQTRPEEYPPTIRVALTRKIERSNPADPLSEPIMTYVGPIGLGFPAKYFNVLFSTGTADIWLPLYASNDPSAVNLHYATGYDPKSSNTSICVCKSYTLNKRGTELTGVTYIDRMTLYEDRRLEDGKISPGDEQDFDQSFMAVTKSNTSRFKEAPYDGVVGLAPIAKSPISQTTHLVVSLKKEFLNYFRRRSNVGELSKRQGYNNFELIFGFWFNAEMSSSQGGELMIGGIDRRRFLEPVVYHPINSQDTWALTMSHVLLGDEIISCSYGCDGVLDTGTPHIVGPEKDVEAIYERLSAKHDPARNMWFVNCDGAQIFPPLVFMINGVPQSVYGQHYVRQVRGPSGLYCYLDIKKAPINFWILGNTFIGAYYTVFDLARRSVGFAQPTGLIVRDLMPDEGPPIQDDAPSFEDYYYGPPNYYDYY